MSQNPNPVQHCQRVDLACIYNPDALEKIILRERARVDRGGGCLALVIFDLPSEDLATAQLLVQAGLRRKRVTDEIGWRAGLAITLVLPDTDFRGAKVVAEAICQMIDARVPYSVYRYPDNRPEDNREGSTAGISGRELGISCQGVFDMQPLLQPKLHFWKRAIDVAGSLSGLLLLSPLFVAIALYIKIVSPGPALYRQERLGKGRQPFQLLKFRSMKPDADDSVHKEYLRSLLGSDRPMIKLDSSNDSRIIPLGKLLRWSCLDELPQLINVLHGEMSLVGPRPCLTYEAEKYQLWHTRRFDVLPGITGLWQVSGKNHLTFNQMARLDIRYGLHLSLRQDLRIILRTGPTMLKLLAESLKISRRMRAVAPVMNGR